MPDPTPEIPKRVSCFPVSLEVAKEVLADIARDPRKIVRAELQTMSRDDPVLVEVLGAMGSSIGNRNAEEFMLGGAFAYMILRHQVVKRGSELPRLPRGYKEIYLRDLQVDANEGEKFGQYSERRLDDISREDSEFTNAIKEITKYALLRDYTRAGAIATYSALKNLLSGRSLSQQLGL